MYDNSPFCRLLVKYKDLYGGHDSICENSFKYIPFDMAIALSGIYLTDIFAQVYKNI